MIAVGLQGTSISTLSATPPAEASGRWLLSDDQILIHGDFLAFVDRSQSAVVSIARIVSYSRHGDYLTFKLREPEDDDVESLVGELASFTWSSIDDCAIAILDTWTVVNFGSRPR